MVEVAKELDNLTVTQMRSLIFDYCDSREIEIESAITKQINKKSSERVVELNDQLNKNFQSKMDLFAKMGRKLTPIKK